MFQPALNPMPLDTTHAEQARRHLHPNGSSQHTAGTYRARANYDLLAVDFAQASRRALKLPLSKVPIWTRAYLCVSSRVMLSGVRIVPRP